MRFSREDIADNALLLRADIDPNQIANYLLQDKQDLDSDSEIVQKQLQIRWGKHVADR